MYRKQFCFYLSLLLLVSCDIDLGYKSPIEGEGPVVTQELDIRDFREVHLAIAADVKIRPGEFAVSMQGQQNILNAITVDVVGGRLEIQSENSFRNSEPVVIEISMPDLDGLSVGGSGDITGEGAFQSLKDLDLSIGGSGSISLDVGAKQIDVSIGGSGHVFLKGESDELEISIGGSGDVDAFGLQTRRSDISIAGSGDVRIHASESLDISIAGSGDVYYKGSPNVTSSKLGSGEIIKQ